MSEPSGFACQLKEAVDGRSVRSLAEQTGWGRSTVHEWLSGVRLPNPQQLDDLLDAVEAPDSLRVELTARLATERELAEAAEEEAGSDGDAGEEAPRQEQAEAATGSAAPEAPVAGDRTPRLPLGVTAVVAGVAVVVVAAAFGGGYAGGRSGVAAATAVPQPASGQETPAVGQVKSATGTGVPVRVAHTLDKGVFTFVGPSSETKRVSSLAEGDQVSVVCLALHGQLKKDATLHQSRTVWALLDTGSWVPDLYLDTEKNWKPPQEPPKPFKVC